MQLSPQVRAPYTLAWVNSLANIDRQAWDRLATPLKTPFLEYDWLLVLETSGSIAAQTGWYPHHLTVHSRGRLVAAAPLYIKHHSQGEFVFDYAWADVAHKMGISYYPKLVGMSPVTPVTGYRFLIAPGEDEEYITGLMLREIERFCLEHKLSGCHFLFVDTDWQRRITTYEFSPWQHQSFVWKNEGYASFEDYLAIFKSRQRHNIRRERRRLITQGIRLQAFCGEEIPKTFFSHMYRLYALTNDQFGPFGCKYLTPSFFEDLYSRFPRRLLFVAAYDSTHEDVPLAMALLLHKNQWLYGRYWGTLRHMNALHFNVCYYFPIEYAITHGIRFFDPGMGGPHKVRRGFKAVSNMSLHRFFDERLKGIMQYYIKEINRAQLEQIDLINHERPLADKTGELPP